MSSSAPNTQTSNKPIFLLDLMATSHCPTDLPPAYNDRQCKEFSQRHARGTSCGIVLYGRTQDHESVCVAVNEFRPYLTLRLKDDKHDDTFIRSVLNEMIEHVSGESRAKRMRASLLSNNLVTGVRKYQGFSTKGFVPDENDCTKRKKFWYVEISFYALEDYKTLQRACKHILHRSPLGTGAIPVEVSHSPEQQFLHAINVSPSSWFECDVRAGILIPDKDKVSTCTHEYHIHNETHAYGNYLRPRPDLSMVTPSLRAMSIDIEVNGHQNIFPKARDPHCSVNTIACMRAWSHETLKEGDECEKTVIFYYTSNPIDLKSDESKKWVQCKDEQSLILAMANHVRNSDVDLITSHNGRAFDWPYLRERYHHAVLKNPNVDRMNDDQRREYNHEISMVTHCGRIPSIVRGVRYSIVDRTHQNEDEEDEEDEDVDSTSRKRKVITQSAMGDYLKPSDDSTQTTPNVSSMDNHGSGIGMDELEVEMDVKVAEPCVITEFGVTDFDLLKYLEKDFQKFDSYSLGDLGLSIVGQSKEDMSANELFAVLTSPTFDGMDRVGNYNRRDVILVLKIIKNRTIIPFLVQVANITHTCLADVCSYGQQFRIGQFFVHTCRQYGFIFEQFGMHEYAQFPWMVGPYEGATVLPTVPCYVHKIYDATAEDPEYDMVVTNDYNSLYPSIIESLNLSPENVPHEDVGMNSTLPEATQHMMREIPIHEIHEPLVRHVYRVVQAPTDDHEHKGILPRMVRDLLQARKDTKRLMKSHDKQSDQYVALDIRQNALKVIANAMYGSLGAINQFGAMSHRMLARLVTYFGRELIQVAKEEFLRIEGVSIVAGDTDSVMAKMTQKTLTEAIRLGEQVATAINERLISIGMRHSKIAFEKCMKPALFLRQKMYAYMKFEDVDDVGDETSMGLMSKKRGTAALFKQAYSLIIRAAMIDPLHASSDEIKLFVHRIMRELLYAIRKAPIESFSKTQSVKPKDSYKMRTAAWYAASKLQQSKGMPWPQDGTRMAIVTQYGTDSQVNKLAVEIEHFKELAAAGKAKLHYVKYIENVQGRFITLLNQLGIDGSGRMERALNAYRALLDNKQSGMMSLWSKSATSAPVMEFNDEYHALFPFDDSEPFLPKRRRAKTVDEFHANCKEDVQLFKRIQDELLDVSDLKMQAVLKAFDHSQFRFGDRRQQERCDKIANTAPTLPLSEDMRQFERWAKNEEAVPWDQVLKRVVSIDCTPFNAKRVERNCYADYNSEYTLALHRIRESEAYKRLIQPELDQANARLKYVAEKMSVGRVIDYKLMINKKIKLG